MPIRGIIKWVYMYIGVKYWRVISLKEYYFVYNNMHTSITHKTSFYKCRYVDDEQDTTNLYTHKTLFISILCSF